MKNVKSLVIALISISLIVGFYYYLTHENDKTVENITDLTEVQNVLEEDLSADYPKTPREVVKLYNRILCCFYNEEYTDEEFEELGSKARQLLDDELLDTNPMNQYMNDLKTDVASYKVEDKVIATETVCGTADVEYKNVSGDECAYVTSSYFVKSGLEYSRTNQQYVLRKDKNDNWKILTFKLIEGDSSDE